MMKPIMLLIDKKQKSRFGIKTLSFIGEGSEVIVRGIGNRVFSCTENGNNLEFINIAFVNLISEDTRSAALYIEGDGSLKIINCTFRDIGARYGDVYKRQVINNNYCYIRYSKI